MIEAVDTVTSNATVDPPLPGLNLAAAHQDEAFLSETAQVKLLEQEGLTVTEIADQLGVTQTQVLSDLGEAAATTQTTAQTTQTTTTAKA